MRDLDIRSTENDPKAISDGYKWVGIVKIRGGVILNGDFRVYNSLPAS